MRTYLLCLFILLISIKLSFARINLEGFIRDAQTKQALPAANLQIEGTLRGTITNNDGKFSLDLDSRPATIRVTYIGYESKVIKIQQATSSLLDINLKPVILETDAIVVLAEDPAMGIMREVIKRKKQWRKNLKTFRADAYSRMSIANDSAIVSIAESVSEAFWDLEKGSREVIKSRRQTSNLESDQNFAFSSHIPNFYDDDIELNGFRMIGPTHPDAFDHYRFKLLKKRLRDDKIVFDIELIPTSILQPTFVGRIAVLDEEFAMIDVDVKPNESMLFPPPIQSWNLFYKQQFNNFGRDYWLPVDVRIDGDVKIGFTGLEFPLIKYSRIASLDDYKVNVTLPDSLYREEKIVTVDSVALASEKPFAVRAEIIPLSKVEELAYQDLDSTMTMEKAFKPTGFLARFAEVTVQSESDTVGRAGGGKSIFSDFTPQLWLNRVDALHLGVAYQKTVFSELKTLALIAYNSGSKKWAYSARLQYFPLSDKKLRLQTSYDVGTRSRYPTPNYSFLLASALPLLSRDDYFDYYWQRAARLELNYEHSKWDVNLNIGLNDEWHSSLSKTENLNFVNSSFTQRENPAIDAGNLRSLDFKLSWGEDWTPFGIVGQKYAELFVERSSAKWLGSDFNFTRYQFSADWRINTFLKRRLLPNALDIRIVGGWSSGQLPLQRFGALDGNLYLFSPFGSFKSRTGRPYEGEKYAAVFWEHNFRTIFFELLGMRYLARKGLGIIVHGAHGRTWIDKKRLQALTYEASYSGRTHNEIGVSLNSLFGIMRIDVTRRLDRPGVYVGASLSRFF